MEAGGRGRVMDRSWPLSVGGRLEIDGETVTVHSVEGAEVRGLHGAG